MNLTTLSKKYNTQFKCITYLEQLRWGKGKKRKVACALCGSDRVTKRKGTIKYHCNKCNSDFSVLYGTIFQDTRLPLPKWFQIIALMLNAKQGMSASQISRTIGVHYKTAWFNCMKVRCGMINPNIELQEIVEMDESYVGGKKRKPNIKVPRNKAILKNVTTEHAKRGRGTHKIPVVGIAQRNGKVVVKVIEKLTARNLIAMFKEYVDEDKTILITDEFKSYKKFDDHVEHLVINHSKQYTKGPIHTNTIESFWSKIKAGIKGNYVVLSKKYLPFYLVEFQYKWNIRNVRANHFTQYLESAVNTEKCMLKYKPTCDVKKIVYPRRKASKKLS